MAEKLTKRERHEKKQGVVKEFITFINKGNAVALAIGVIIGSAFGAIVTAINVNIISPLIAFLIGDTDLSNCLKVVLKQTQVGVDENNEPIYEYITINFGAFIQAVLDFLLVAIILFVITKIVSDVYKKVNQLNSNVKSKIDARLEKEFEKDEAKRKAKAGIIEPSIDEPIEESTEGSVEEVVENEVPAMNETNSCDEQTELLKEIRDLLKATQK